MTILGFKELVAEEIGKQGLELDSLIDFNLITSSRENYLIYLRWLLPLWVAVETQIADSPLAERQEIDLQSKLRASSLKSDCQALLGTQSSQGNGVPPTGVRVFDDTPSLGAAAGALYILADIQLDHKSLKKNLQSIGIRGRSMTRFYRGTSWSKSRRSERIARWINANLTARERAEAIEGAYLTAQTFVSHFTRFRSSIDSLPPAAAS